MWTIIGGAFAFACFGVGVLSLAKASNEARSFYKRIKGGF